MSGNFLQFDPNALEGVENTQVQAPSISVSSKQEEDFVVSDLAQEYEDKEMAAISNDQLAMSNEQNIVKPKQTELDGIPAFAEMTEEKVIKAPKHADPMKREVVPYEAGTDIVDLINQMFNSGIHQGASDIHIEPFETFLAIRFRVDGEFQEFKNFDTRFAEQILTRLEVLAGLKLDKNRLPQDGKINYTSDGKRVDMRVSTFPTMYGNKVCIRLLIKDDAVASIYDLGYSQDALRIIQKNLDRTFGMILMTGPTGSGKSTTLFGMLTTYDPFKQNISTLEDPIEYFIPGANQSQVNVEIGYDFPDGLRTLVRQDPDIIMVGEIRDKVTASLAVNAAITGHLVFSTLHANSASATIQRLMNMDVDPFLVTSALNLIVSQRLVRKICTKCKTSFTPDARTLEMVKEEMKNINHGTELQFFKGEGCDACKGQGYKGRMSIYELLEVTPEIAHTIIEKKAVAEEIEKVAIEKQRMITIKQNGILAALAGETSLEEVLIASDSVR